MLATVDATIAYGVEQLTLLDGATRATGNEEDNILVGNSAANILQGRDGDDLLSGGAGNDQLNADQGNDTLMGGVGNDTLLGGEGNDTLNGEAVPTCSQGGLGDDTYILADSWRHRHRAGIRRNRYGAKRRHAHARRPRRECVSYG